MKQDSKTRGTKEKPSQTWRSGLHKGAHLDFSLCTLFIPVLSWSHMVQASSLSWQLEFFVQILEILESSAMLGDVGLKLRGTTINAVYEYIMEGKKVAKTKRYQSLRFHRTLSNTATLMNTCLMAHEWYCCIERRFPPRLFKCIPTYSAPCNTLGSASTRDPPS